MNILCRKTDGKYRKGHILWLFLLFPAILNAQSMVSVCYSPESMDFLGHLRYYSKLDFEFSQKLYDYRSFTYEPAVRLSFLNFHEDGRKGYTDRYGVPPGPNFWCIGVVPLGFTVRLFHSPVYADGSIGAAWFPKKFPNSDGRNINALLEAGIHVKIWKTLLLGYRFSHISNAWTGRVNPGLDSSMLSVGIVLR